jgi:NADH-quinone oxidoreductase subunit N
MESAPLFNPLSYSGLFPEYAVFAGIVLICLIIFLLPRLAGGISLWVALLSLFGAFFLSENNPDALMPESLSLQSWTWVLKRYFCVATSVALFAWLEWKQERPVELSPIFIALLLLATLSLMILVQATGLWAMLLAAEGFSFCAYALSAGPDNTKESREGILRYFGLGALATAVSVFGLSWIVGFQDIVLPGNAGFSDSLAFFPVAGAVLFLAFLFFKLGCFPFQNWVPGIFLSAPSPLAGFLAAAPKVAAGFACLNLVQNLDINLGFPMIIMALFTGLLGNLAAFQSSKVKEMLAFSAIGQASFLLIPSIFSRQVSGADGHLLYFALAYATSVQAAFSACQYFENHLGDRLNNDDLQGMFKKHPAVALIFSALLLAIVGLPPFAGFTGKLLVMTGLPGGSNLLPSGWLYGLFFLGLINTVLAAGYFMKLPFAMFFKSSNTIGQAIRPSSASLVIMVLGLAYQLLAFVYPGFFLPGIF